MFGANASAAFGAVSVDGFVLYQSTVGLTAKHQNGFAANASVKAKAGVGTVKASMLYTSGGDRNVFVTTYNETSPAYMESGVFSDANSILLFRGNGYRTSNTDQSIIPDASNKGAGVTALFIGYDGAINKTFFNINSAFVSDSKNGGNGTTASYAGTEINGEIGYKLYDNLKLSVQGALVFLGPKYSHTDGAEYANSPYLGRVILGYNF